MPFQAKQSETMKKQLDAYLDALNEHRTDEAMRLLADDFQLHFSGYNMTIDKNGMADVLGWDKGVNGEVAYENLSVAADSITAVFTERNDFFRLIGIEALQATITYTFDRAGQIVKQTYTPLPDQPSFQQKMQPAIDWARANRPEELDEIYPQNQIHFNQEMGKRWVALLKAWKKATQAE